MAITLVKHGETVKLPRCPRLRELLLAVAVAPRRAQAPCAAPQPPMLEVLGADFPGRCMWK
jgi:hypothetical protein